MLLRRFFCIGEQIFLIGKKGLSHKMWILQISDLHIDNFAQGDINPDEIRKLACAEACNIVPNNEPLALVFCGDAIYKGHSHNYPSVRLFLKDMTGAFSKKVELCLCPGNHDICDNETHPFEGFNRLSWDLIKDERYLFAFDKTVVTRTILDTDFVLVNSSYHRDYTYGLVNMNHLEYALDKSKSPTKVIVVHHSLIPIDPSDKSTVANACDVLRLAVSHDVTAILHGHCHRQILITVGKNPCSLVGVGSFLFPPGSNLNNQFNLLRFDSNKITEALGLRFIADLWKSGRSKTFESTKLYVI